MLDKMRENAQSWGIKIIFGVIILAFIFAFAGPGGGEDPVVAYVNGAPITVQEFQRVLQQQESQTPETRQAVLGSLARNELLRQFAADHGIVVTEGEVREAIRTMSAFQSEGGGFDLAKYKGIVRDPEAFEQDTRDEMLKGKLAGFLSLPAMPSEAEAHAIFEWQNEKTSLEYVSIPAASFLAQAKVDPAAVVKYYEENQFLFQQPQRAEFDYIAFTPKGLAAKQEVSEQDIADHYEKFAATLMQPRTASYSEILIAVGDNPTQESVDEAAGQARALLQALADGTPFDQAAPGGALELTSALDDLPPGVSQALSGLEPGGISAPVPTTEGLAILKLHSLEEARPYTLDEARQIIVERISEQRALESLDDAVEEAIAALSQGNDLARTAEIVGLPLEHTGPRALMELQQEFSLGEEPANALFAQEIGKVSNTPVRLTEGYLVAVKTADLAPMTLPIADVRGEIGAKLMLDTAQDLARTRAEAILLGQDTDHTFQTSAAFTRSGPIPVPGANAQIVADAFAAKPGAWLPSPYQVPGGLVVARAMDVTKPGEAQWVAEQAMWMRTAGEIARRELNVAFQQHIFANADASGVIEVVRPELLQ
ncbi:MAG: SurA N-terminal domain-containing protein [Desulfovibrionaceae bacterium]